MQLRIGRFVGVIVGMVCAAGIGCTAVNPQRPDFSKTLERGAGDAPLVLDDVLAIVNNNSLPVDQRRQMLRDLGIEDEDLINALVPTP